MLWGVKKQPRQMGGTGGNEQQQMEHATNYTMWALFMRATITVKLVMIG